jgi:folylpolyglutamate synthase/dihydropteroate synthase
LDLHLNILKKRKVDIAIIEVGMGGRLDATSINPIISGIYQ